jgi:hypothetical protein
MMRKLALGIAAAATIFTAVPAMAQVGLYAGPGGVGVQFGGPYGYYGYAPYRGYYDYAPAPAYGWHRHEWHGHGRIHAEPHIRH